MEHLNDDEIILPKPSEIPKPTLEFMMGLGFNHFSDISNPELFNNLLTEITAKSTHLETHLQFLHTKLGSLLISWGSRSIRANISLEDLTLDLENLSLISSQYGSRTHSGRRVQKILTRDFPYISKELRRIESLRYYAVVALKLEALVGDLEDAVSSALNQHSRYVDLRTFSSSSIPVDVHGKLGNVHKAVKAISDIEELLLDVLRVHPRWCNLLRAVDNRVDKSLSVIRPQVIADHRSLLASMGWPPKLSTSNMQNGEGTDIPNPLVLMQGEKKESYSQSFLALCALQHVQLRREKRLHLARGQKKEEDVSLWAIDELVSPVASRIEHHLLKWTDQPEFIFALVYKITHDFIEGVDHVLQPLIDKARLVNCSAKEAWVSAMVQFLSGFLARRIFPNLAERYRNSNTKSDAIFLWLQLIDHVVKFDECMRSLLSSEMYLFLGEAGAHTELGRTMSVLSLFCERPDWLRIWAKVELKDAWKKLKAEFKDERSWLIDERHVTGQNTTSEQFFLSTREDHKAPLAAEFPLKLTWEMIQRCKTLPGTSSQIHFMRSAVRKFLRHFFKLLLSRHKNSEFSTFDNGETLVKTFQLINVTRYSEFKLREWSDDVDLLELRLTEKGLDMDSGCHATCRGCFFEEEIESLVEMETNWLMEVIAYVLREFENISFYYFHNVNRFELASSDSNQVNGKDMILSNELAEALDNLRSQLLLIKKHLNANDFLDTWRSVADGLDRFIFHSILSTDVRFSDEGAKHCTVDMEGLFLVFQVFCARPEAFFPCIGDFLKLLKFGKSEAVDLKLKLMHNVKGSECLRSHNILNLSVDQAWIILNNRTFLL